MPIESADTMFSFFSVRVIGEKGDSATSPSLTSPPMASLAPGQTDSFPSAVDNGKLLDSRVNETESQQPEDSNKSNKVTEKHDDKGLSEDVETKTSAMDDQL